VTDAERELSSILSEFARTMLTDFPIQEILDRLVTRIVGLLPITGAGVTLIDPSIEPRYIAASDPTALHFEQLQTELGQGPCVVAYRTSAPVIVPNLHGDDRFAAFADRAVEMGMHAVFTFPLRQGQRCLGALDLYRDEAGSLTAEEASTAQTLADVTAAYLVNAQARAVLQHASDRSHERSVHDPLTGLPNRTLLVQRIDHAIVRSGRSKKLVAVLFIDLDNFKGVNDAHGHQAGDDLLVAVGERITASLRPEDTLARLSGDEFVILCEELDQAHQAEIVADRVGAELAKPFPLVGAAVELSASVGIAFASSTNFDAEHLLHAADTAMYQVKRKGGGSHQVLDLPAQRLSDNETGLRFDLNGALVRGELRLDYQPIVDTDDGRIEGVEALLRWDHPDRGAVPPAVLVPIAEQSGMILKIGRWVLEQACRDRSGWSADRACGLAVNISAYQLMAPDFVAMVAAILSETHMDAGSLTLEITEGALIRDTARAHLVLDDLKRLGLLLALDDFGTGYSSLSYLKQFPVDIIKIDQSFVTDLTRDRSSHAIVSKTIELAHLLDLQVICEGVETWEQHASVSDLGCDSCQGFYFGRPTSSALVEVLMSRVS
jgi:diguanylate cyclase (GGDEF)-like protein